MCKHACHNKMQCRHMCCGSERLRPLAFAWTPSGRLHELKRAKTVRVALLAVDLVEDVVGLVMEYSYQERLLVMARALPLRVGVYDPQLGEHGQWVEWTVPTCVYPIRVVAHRSVSGLGLAGIMDSYHFGALEPSLQSWDLGGLRFPGYCTALLPSVRHGVVVVGMQGWVQVTGQQGLVAGCVLKSVCSKRIDVSESDMLRSGAALVSDRYVFITATYQQTSVRRLDLLHEDASNGTARWQPSTPLPKALTDCVLASWDGWLYVISHNGCFKTRGGDNDAWHELPKAPRALRSVSLAVCIGNELYVVVPGCSMDVFNLLTETWREKAQCPTLEHSSWFRTLACAV
jgi:hypothetical protein